MRKRIPIFALAALVTLAVSTVGGARDTARKGGTLVFGSARDPLILDPILVSDGESLRPIRQMYEGLLTVKPGTARVVPSLALRWKVRNRGRSWTFILRRGVRFHDNTRFNAAAVCANFNRWYGFTGAFQSSAATSYWQSIFGGFRSTVGNPRSPVELRTSLFKSCRVLGRYTVRITLTRPSASFLGALSLPSFSMSSPRALRRYNANRAEMRGGSPVFTGSYGFSHPTGTGPFKFSSWTRGNRLVLVRNPRYWGRDAYLNRLIFRPIANNAARLQALQTGELQGYDLVEPADMPAIRANRRLRLLDRPMFNIAYVAINQKAAPMNKLAVRQAVAYGLNRGAVIRSFYAGRGQVAHAFMPPGLLGYAKDVKKYSFQPQRARRLLQRAGLRLPVRIEFWYPTGVSRPYMPDPRRNFEAFAASLEQSGFDVVARGAPWSPDYLNAAQTGKAGHLHLLGWTGDYADPDNFLGEFFQRPKPQWGFNNPRLHRLLDRAESTPSAKKRAALYQQANRLIMEFLPGVPYAHTRPALAFQRRVRGYIPSPVSLEPFRLVWFGGT
ncbi:MAG: ABC transporter substrate-binding protein [Actinomycetota bacterium]|nr:ABC transporter substrate-binding protein [Actinomycetota bacterium]